MCGVVTTWIQVSRMLSRVAGKKFTHLQEFPPDQIPDAVYVYWERVYLFIFPELGNSLVTTAEGGHLALLPRFEPFGIAKVNEQVLGRPRSSSMKLGVRFEIPA